MRSLLPLCPFFDSLGLLRVRGRLSKINISYDRKHQIILPKRHHFTNLVVQYYHEKIGHSGAEATLVTTRQKYWIVSGINTIKYYLKTCVTCIKKHTQINPQLLGNLPHARVAAWEPAYTHTSIDYYGPFVVTTGIRSKTPKVWGVIFTFLTCHAVHLDIVDSLPMDACLNVIERFMAQYADVTSAFYSDNGTNFRGISNALRKMYTKNIL